MFWVGEINNGLRGHGGGHENVQCPWTVRKTLKNPKAEGSSGGRERTDLGVTVAVGLVSRRGGRCSRSQLAGLGSLGSLHFIPSTHGGDNWGKQNPLSGARPATFPQSGDKVKTCEPPHTQTAAA